MARVLVTGGTGFVGAHCLIQLLAAGHETRATVRNMARESDVRAMLLRPFRAGRPRTKMN
jgi:dihydroflavonol-4-reductase